MLATAELAESEAALWLGYGGGALLSVALLPQMLHTLRTGSTADLSYGWQAVYILGLWLDFAYFLLIGATAGWATSLLEIFFAHVLTAMKLRNEGLTCLRRREQCECGCSPFSRSVAVGRGLPLPWASELLAEMASAASGGGAVAHSGTYEGLPSNAVLDVEANVEEVQPGFSCLVVLGAGYVLAHYDRAAGCLLLDAYVAGLAKEAQESLLAGLADFAGKASAICEI